jgi:glycosyltransferase involved in cell wall biosynthesis
VTQEAFGDVVAENGLIHATLAADENLLWDFYMPAPHASLTEAAEVRQYAPDLTHLRKQFGQRVAIRTVPLLEPITDQQDYVFAASVPSFPRISELREQMLCRQAPICGMLHSAYTKDLLSCYTWLLISTRPYDMLVASSKAGKTALENMLQSVGDYLARRLGMQPPILPSPRCLLIPFGVDIPQPEALDRAQARFLLQIPQDCFVILYLGRISQEYKADLDLLLLAVARLLADGQNIRLLLAGQASDKVYNSHLHLHLSQLRLLENVILCENFPPFLKSSIYAACDVFVSPVDSIQETFGLSVLEAMAHARPVIAPNWSGYRDLIVERETGVLLKTRWSRESAVVASALAGIFSPHETAHYLAQRTIIDIDELIREISTLIANPAAAAEMGKRGRQRVSHHFAWPIIARQFLELWTHQVEHSRTAPDSSNYPFLNFDHFFSHYAEEMLSPNDLLVKAETQHDLTGDWSDAWRFYNPAHVIEIRALLNLCQRSPMAVGELRELGFSMDCILWVAKKGLGRIIGTWEIPAV